MLDFTGQAVLARDIDKYRLLEVSQPNQGADGVGE